MPHVRDVLYRFRPAGAPGAASATGVPKDRRSDAAAELEPLFTAIEPTERSVEAIARRATDEAARIRAEGETRAAEILTAAAARASSEQAAAVAQAQQHSEAEAQALMESARAEAAALLDRAHARMPECVAQVVDAVSTLLGESSTADREVVAS
jgi:vacuolar-type H+-ATPase subunit H